MMASIFEGEMDSESQLCELHRLADGAALAEVARALEAHGIESDVWPERRRRLVPWAATDWRLMVRCRDVVYARWLAAAHGLDTWPDASAAESG